MSIPVATINLHLELITNQVDRLQAEQDELRRLLRQCLPYLVEARRQLDPDDATAWLEVMELIDHINASAREPDTHYDHAADDDGDMLDEVPF